jgi:hypothetical protein
MLRNEGIAHFLNPSGHLYKMKHDGADSVHNFRNTTDETIITKSQVLFNATFLLEQFVVIAEIVFQESMMSLRDILQAISSSASRDKLNFPNWFEGEQCLQILGDVLCQVGGIYSLLQAREAQSREPRIAVLCFDGASNQMYNLYTKLCTEAKLKASIKNKEELFAQISYYPLKLWQNRLLAIVRNKKNHTKVERESAKMLFHAYNAALDDSANKDSWYNVYTRLRQDILHLKIPDVELTMNIGKDINPYCTELIKSFKISGKEKEINFRPMQLDDYMIFRNK